MFLRSVPRIASLLFPFRPFSVVFVFGQLDSSNFILPFLAMPINAMRARYLNHLQTGMGMVEPSISSNLAAWVANGSGTTPPALSLVTSARPK
jgi:hypothetical protein